MLLIDSLIDSFIPGPEIVLSRAVSVQLSLGLGGGAAMLHLCVTSFMPETRTFTTLSSADKKELHEAGKP